MIVFMRDAVHAGCIMLSISVASQCMIVMFHNRNWFNVII